MLLNYLSSLAYLLAKKYIVEASPHLARGVTILAANKGADFAAVINYRFLIYVIYRSTIILEKRATKIVNATYK